MAYPTEDDAVEVSNDSNYNVALPRKTDNASETNNSVDVNASAAKPRRGSGTALGTLSKIALKETMTELSISAQQTKAVSSATLQWLRLGAEKRLGIDVQLEDPAMDELFGYLLQVENSLEELRCHTDSLLQGAQLLCDGVQHSSSSSFQTLVGKVSTGASSTKQSGINPRSALAESFTMLSRSGIYERVPEMVADAVRNTFSLSPNAGGAGSARYQLVRRLEEEVLDVIDSQFAEHDHLRELIRERQVCGKKLEQCQRQVATLRKQGSGGSGLRPLVSGATGFWGSSGNGAEERLRLAQTQVSSLDGDVLAKLLEIKAQAHGLVARPWAAFAQIRAEFFASLAGHWAPVATALCDPSTGRRRSSQSSNSPPRDLSETTENEPLPPVGTHMVSNSIREDSSDEAEDSIAAPTFSGEVDSTVDAPRSPSDASLAFTDASRADG